MKQNFLFVIILLFTNCQSGKKEDFVFEEFKSQIEKHGMKIDSIDENQLIYISQGDLTLKISLDNLRKNYERDKDKSLITDFVQTLITSTKELPKNWNEVKNDIYLSLFSNDFDFQDILHQKLTDQISKVYVHQGDDRITWISSDDMSTWKITERELEEQANANADKLLSSTSISIDTIEKRKLGMIEIDPPTLKAALLFAPSMKDKINKDFGYPFYAVIPVRDFCYIFSEKDLDFFSNVLGPTVMEEFTNSGYPITTEILKFSNKGVEAVSSFK